MGWLERLLWPERQFTRYRAVLREAVQRIVRVAHPDEVILFGSVARGQLRSGSDLDLLVVKSGVTDPSRLAREIHANLFGILIPVDVVVATPESLEASRGKVSTFLGRIQQHGKCVYRNGTDRSRPYR